MFKLDNYLWIFFEYFVVNVNVKLVMGKPDVKKC